MLDQLARLEAATALIHDLIREGASYPTIVNRLIHEHGATVKTSPSTNSLRVAGVVTSCTWSADKGLIDGWRRLANRRILRLQGKSE